MREYEQLFRHLNVGILIFFAVDVVMSWFSAPNRLTHLKRYWYELFIFIPLVLLITGGRTTPRLQNLMIQAVIIIIVVVRIHRIYAFFWLLSARPAQLMLGSFASVILVGTALLMLPAATRGGLDTTLGEAFFTATSATCVTGLIVVDTPNHFSFFGQAVILALIQLGGLGIMTFSVCFALLLNRRLSLRNQRAMQEILDQDTLKSAKRLVGFIVLMTFLLEVIGALILFVNWHDSPRPVLSDAWHAVFNSVSAFCNAGFSTFSNSLEGSATDRTVNYVIGALIILGGLGFPVIRDLYHKLLHLFHRRDPHRFRLQSRVVLVCTGGLLLLGTGFFYLLEYNHILAEQAGSDALLISFFQSITTRTAGFNTCDIGALQSSTLYVFIFLMFIGASPGGTGGGIKTTTLATAWAVIRAGFRNRPQAELYRRTIPMDLIQRAVMVLCSAALLVAGSTIVLCALEDQSFLALHFEAVSAFATVGLSTGITAELSTAGRLVLCLLMFVGRLGPLTVGFALMLRQKPAARYTYATERIMIG
jgi:trk system potassium uptake protein TrkH